MRLSAHILALASVLVGAPSLTHAVPIQDLFDGGTITVGDKLFSDWVLERNEIVDGAGTPNVVGTADTNLINVAGLAGDPLNPGLRYSSDSEWFVDFVSNRVTQFFRFSFEVSTVDASARIVGNSIELTDYEINDTAPFLGIFESVDSSSGDALGTKEILIEAPTFVTFDSITFAPQASIRVETSLIIGIDAGGDLRVGAFEQRFAQVAEPGTLAMLAISVFFTARGRSRRAY